MNKLQMKKKLQLQIIIITVFLTSDYLMNGIFSVTVFVS